jgi:hypothetical protein
MPQHERGLVHQHLVRERASASQVDVDDVVAGCQLTQNELTRTEQETLFLNQLASCGMNTDPLNGLIGFDGYRA